MPPIPISGYNQINKCINRVSKDKNNVALSVSYFQYDDALFTNSSLGLADSLILNWLTCLKPLILWLELNQCLFSLIVSSY